MTNRTMSRPVTAITAFLPIESENSRIEAFPSSWMFCRRRDGDASRYRDECAGVQHAVTLVGMSRSGAVRNYRNYERICGDDSRPAAARRGSMSERPPRAGGARRAARSHSTLDPVAIVAPRDLRRAAVTRSSGSRARACARRSSSSPAPNRGAVDNSRIAVPECRTPSSHAGVAACRGSSCRETKRWRRRRTTRRRPRHGLPGHALHGDPRELRRARRPGALGAEREGRPRGRPGRVLRGAAARS